jgi:hypothetical protein
VDTANRVLWGFIGIVLLAAGAFGVLASLGRIPPVARSAALWNERLVPTGSRAAAIAIAAGLVLAALGIVLIVLELRRRRPRAMSDLVSADTAPGRTRVTAATLDHALAADLRSAPSVKRAAAYLSGDARDPAIALRLVVAPDADLAALRSHVEGALRRFGTTAGLDPRIREVAVRIGTQEPTRLPVAPRVR